jgi:hypothetical protein
MRSRKSSRPTCTYSHFSEGRFLVISIDLLALEYDKLIHFTPTAEQRRSFSSLGLAMPDGSFYIRPLPKGRGDLHNAINAVGRATPNASESEIARRNSVRRHVMKRAAALKLTSMIPDTWNSDGSLKQSAILVEEVEDFLAHYGVKGMHWGVRRSDAPGVKGFLQRSPTANAELLGKRLGIGRGNSGESSAAHPGNHPSLNAPRPRVSSDAETARALMGRVKKSGTSNLSNQELQQLVTRMNLERQYSNLNPKHVNAGQKFTQDLLKDSGKQMATQFIVKNAPKGAAWVVKKIGKKVTVRAAQAAVGAAVSTL